MAAPPHTGYHCRYGRRSIRNMTLGRVKSSAARRQTGAPVAAAAGVPFAVYLTVELLTTESTAKLPLYSASLAPLIVMMSFFPNPWLAEVTSVAVVPDALSRETARPLNKETELAGSQNGYPVAGDPVVVRLAR